MSLTELDQAAVERSFNRVAADYDEHAVLQKEVESRLLERLMFVRKPPEMVLDLGCGTGRSALALQQHFPAARVVVLDRSPAMLGQLTRRSDTLADPFPLCADFSRLPLASASVDLIFSSLALHLCADPGRAFMELRRVLRPDGMLLFTSFGPDTLHELREAWSQVDDGAHVHEFMDMHDVGDRLVTAGFAEPVMDVDFITLKYADVRSLVRGLRRTGATNATGTRSRGLTGKGKWAAFCTAYEHYRREDRYPATWEVIFGAAFGPPEGQPMRTSGGDVATFSIDALRDSARKGH
jgi:malonyl-CoA O-methyltransferase